MRNKEGDMIAQARYQILASHGRASFGVFSVAAEQPPEADGDWLLMVNDYTGEPLMVHTTRLIPLGLTSFQVRYQRNPMRSLASVAVG
jgi:hypothetical protein